MGLAMMGERMTILLTHRLESGPPIRVKSLVSNSLTTLQIFVPLLMALNIKNSLVIGVLYT